MDKRKIIQKTADHIKGKLTGESSGHDWWHVYRVWSTAIHIGKKEKADMFIVELAALLHDIADWKFHGGDASAGSRAAREWLLSLGVDEGSISHVCDIIDGVSYKGAGVKTQMTTKEGMVVQDADRLDAMGAIGIARAFAYGGSANREMYSPGVKAEAHQTFEQYKSSRGTTVNHFYEKLLLLKDRMNTATGKRIAEKRHRYMEQYLKRFYKEWEGKD